MGNTTMENRTPLFTSSDWDFETLEKVYKEIENVALNDLGLDTYPTQIEIISSEQMLDAYASIGMPLMYEHWSFGKHFVREGNLYRKGLVGLAYEIVINTSPCICYCMEDNTMALQALVMAHAGFGHNHFFKNNYLFKQWSDAEGILGYLAYAKGYVSRCAESYGMKEVEKTLDAAHALMNHGVFRYERRTKSRLDKEEIREERRRENEERTFNVLWSTLPRKGKEGEASEEEKEIAKRKKMLNLPEENILYFLEKFSPAFGPGENWKREIIRIVRNVAQYFYPQRQTKVMNEGCATFVHYYIMCALHERGLLTEGAMQEILVSHTNVIAQPDFDDPRFNGINPYKLGFEMMRDIVRISTGIDQATNKPCSQEQLDEDKEWFPGIAGCGDWRSVLKDAWANFRDESFILQFLSPYLIRKLRLFEIFDDEKSSYQEVAHVSDDAGYKAVRRDLAKQYDLGLIDPNIQVVDVDLRGDRLLRLEHTIQSGIQLDDKDRDMTLHYLRQLWGYDVSLESIHQRSGETAYKIVAEAEGIKVSK